MKPEEVKKVVADIVANLSDQGKVTELLTNIVGAYETTYQTNESLTAAQQETEQKIKSLQDTNMKLFLKVAQPVESPKVNSDQPLSYDDLLKDFGGIE